MKSIKDIWKEKKWQFVGVAFLLLECYVVLNVFVPSVKAIIEAKREVNSRQQKIASVSDWENKMQKMRKSEKNIQDGLSKLLLRVPESDRISTLTRFLDQTASESGITINRIQPETHRVKKQQVTIPVKLSSAGDFGAMGTFINKLEEAQFVIKVEQARLYKTDFSAEKIHADLRLNWIVLKGPDRRES